MTAVELDFDNFFDGLESASTFSNTTTSPTTTENDSDSGIASTPSMPIDLDNTVIDLDNLDIPPLNMDGPFFDDEFNWFSSVLFDEKNPLMPADNSTFESLFPGTDLFDQGNQELPQQIVNIIFQQSKKNKFLNIISLATTSIKISRYSFDKQRD
jgi:hypothetical protein